MSGFMASDLPEKGEKQGVCGWASRNRVKVVALERSGKKIILLSAILLC
jgi:hypothetical protein